MSLIALENPNHALEAGRDVLLKEAQCIINVANALNGPFTDVVQALLQVKGRIIVTGMGKMGHIGNKIAATLASTGSPAFFVHPGEASHGDLGMITEEDAVLALSNSGESKELADIIAYCKRFDIPLVAVTGKLESTLGKAADFVLENGVKEEACPINMAPTSSTTVTLALCDAIAIALMTERGFKPEDFNTFHPGGKLGSKLLKVSEVMVQENDVPLCTPDDAMGDVIITMTNTNRGCVGIVDAGKLTGIITDGDLKRHMGPDMFTKKASELMSLNPLTIKADVLASEAVNTMYNNEKNREVTALFVVDDAHKPVGLIQLQQCLQVGVV